MKKINLNKIHKKILIGAGIFSMATLSVAIAVPVVLKKGDEKSTTQNNEGKVVVEAKNEAAKLITKRLIAISVIPSSALAVYSTMQASKQVYEDAIAAMDNAASSDIEKLKEDLIAAAIAYNEAIKNVNIIIKPIYDAQKAAIIAIDGIVVSNTLNSGAIEPTAAKIAYENAKTAAHRAINAAGSIIEVEAVKVAQESLVRSAKITYDNAIQAANDVNAV